MWWWSTERICTPWTTAQGSPPSLLSISGWTTSVFLLKFFSITPVRFHSVRVRDWEKKHLANSDMDSQCFSIYDFPKLHDDSFQSTSIVDSGTFSIFCLFCWRYVTSQQYKAILQWCVIALLPFCNTLKTLYRYHYQPVVPCVDPPPPSFDLSLNFLAF